MILRLKDLRNKYDLMFFNWGEMKKNDRNIKHQPKKNTFKVTSLPLSNNKNKFLPYIIVFCIPVLLYIQTLTFGFTYFDDDDIIINNLAFFSDFNNAHLAFLTDAFIGKSSSFYRPLQTLSYMIDIQLSGGNHAWMYHLSNVLLIGCIACSLFILLRKFSIPEKTALLGTLIYCAHPLFVSSIAWIPARGDLQLTLFSLLSFIFLIEFLQKKKNKYLYLHWAAFTLALLSKETAMFLPFLFALYYFIYIREKCFEKKYLLVIFLYAISGILLYWLRLKAIGSFSNKNDEIGIASALWNLQTIPEALAMFFIPYKIAPFPNFSLFKTITGLAVIIVLIILFFRNKERTNKEKFFGISWFILLLLPSMIYRNPHIDYLNHRFSLPMIGMLVFVLFLFPKKWFEKSSVKTSWIMIAIIIFLSSFTIVKSRSYTDPMTFYNSSISMNPNSALAYFNRGCIKRDNKKNIEDVIVDFSKAIELNPKYTKAYNNRGYAYGKQGLSEKAIADYTKAIELKPEYADAYSNRASEYFQQKNYAKAIADYTKAIEIKPKFAVAYYNRAIAYTNQGSKDKAIDDYTKAIELNPEYSDAYYNRGNIYCTTESYDKAIKDYTKTLELKPGVADVYYNRGVAYSSSGKLDEAINDFSKIIEMDPGDAGSYYERGNTYYKKGLQDNACSDYKKAEMLGLKKAKEQIEKYCR
jgi:tetratricopeptide (TPR) repeat protein